MHRSDLLPWEYRMSQHLKYCQHAAQQSPTYSDFCQSPTMRGISNLFQIPTLYSNNCSQTFEPCYYNQKVQVLLHAQSGWTTPCLRSWIVDLHSLRFDPPTTLP